MIVRDPFTTSLVCRFVIPAQQRIRNHAADDCQHGECEEFSALRGHGRMMEGWMGTVQTRAGKLRKSGIFVEKTSLPSNSLFSGGAGANVVSPGKDEGVMNFCLASSRTRRTAEKQKKISYARGYYKDATPTFFLGVAVRQTGDPLPFLIQKT